MLTWVLKEEVSRTRTGPPSLRTDIGGCLLDQGMKIVFPEMREMS
jgi:hypothetical protein